MYFPFAPQTNKQFDAVGFGLNAVDHLIVVPEYPAFDTKMRLLEHKQSAGGQTASAMVSLKRLGMNTAYAGRFGSDAEGQFGLATLKEDGVNVDYAQIVEGASTQIAFITIDARSGERTIVWNRDDRLAYQPAEAPAEFGALGKVLHLDAHDPPACLRLAKVAKEHGVIVCADIDNVYDGLPDLLPFIDIMIGSKEFPRRVTGVTDERESLVQLQRRFGCSITGMTIGAGGAIIYCREQFIESRGFHPPGGCRDTTGAGDAFHAGFLYGFLTGEDVETSARLGNAVASMKCGALGARAALPTKAELEEFLRTAIPI